MSPPTQPPTGPDSRKPLVMPRRGFLRGLGVALALPLLESGEALGLTEPIDDARPGRMLAVCNNLGLLPGKFFPGEGGREYQLSPYLEELADHRDDFTVFSGVSHPGVDGSHSSDVSFLTAAPHPGGGGFRNTISLDQVVAGKVGHLTRFPSLTLGVNAKAGRRSLSWTRAGVLIPCENSAADVYRRLFLQGTREEIEQQLRRLRRGQSILDAISARARELGRRISRSDQDRMEQYTTAIREVERRLELARAWEKKPRPQPGVPAPVDPGSPADYMEKVRLMYDMARLAFQTDSTRAITLLLDSNNSPTIRVDDAAITDGYHNLSHHGKSPSKLAQLEAIDRTHLRLLSGLLSDLKKVDDGPGTLLDRTQILYGSNFGDANKHTTTNMPVILAGGPFRHGQHLAFDRGDNYPLPDLFVSMLQGLGLEEDRFAGSHRTMHGLDLRS